MRLSNKVAAVTGGANGIGAATVELFTAEGAHVVIADRDAAAGPELASRLQADGGTALFVATDVSNDDSVAGLIDQTVAAYGGVDILVNCAGISLDGSVVNTPTDRWQRVLDVNLTGAGRTCRQAIPHMIRRGSGAIVNVASIQGMYGWPNYAAYAASKAGLIGLTRQLAVEYADRRIRANAVSPGGILTDLGSNTERLEPQFSDPRRHQPAPPHAPPPQRPVSGLRGPGLPRDVAWAVLFLASDEAIHISGQNLVVDGIATARVE